MKYGCNNRPDYKPTLMVQDGYTPTLTVQNGNIQIAPRQDKTVEIPFTMTTECQYTKTDLGKTDPKCNNCERKSP